MSESSTTQVAGATTNHPPLELTRVFDAPRELVWQAWTDPARLAQWWGPRDWGAAVHELDLRPGGVIRVDMLGPEPWGAHPMGGTFHEVTPPERLVFTSRAFGNDTEGWQLEVLNTVTFTAEGDRTRMTLMAEVKTATAAVAESLAGMEQGWSQSLDKLAAQVEGRADREIVLARVFDAPRELVWQVWTDPAQADQWWGPNGFTNTTLEHEFRVGGVWRYTMHGPDGKDYPNRQVYKVIDPQHRLVYDHGWDDDALPPLFLATITFTEIGSDKTEVELRSTFPTAAERDRVVKEVGAIEGGKQTLAKLGEYLAQLQGKQA
jgi:uncharacterized protein YndB with AHSA1/START domain